jgi:hypothetical protein|tara:strand:+ start:3078 stop:3512 length:435 start_codon:yes stop_codon:yes gene_type:complete
MSLLYSNSCYTLDIMNTQLRYNVKASHIPVWTLADRLTKARNGTGMSMKAFSAFTSLSTRQIQYAEGGLGSVSDVIVTVYAAKTGVDYWWLSSGEDLDQDPDGPDGGDSLLGLDSNQEPIGSLSSYIANKIIRERALKFMRLAA